MRERPTARSIDPRRRRTSRRGRQAAVRGRALVPSRPGGAAAPPRGDRGARAVEQPTDEPRRAAHLIEDGPDLGARQDDGQSSRRLGPIEAVQGLEVPAEDSAVEEDQCTERLILGRGADVLVDGQVREKAPDLVAPHVGRMASATVVKDETARPVDVRLLGAGAVVEDSDRLAHPVEQARPCGALDTTSDVPGGAHAAGSRAEGCRRMTDTPRKQKTREPGSRVKGILAQRTTGCASFVHVVAVGLSALAGPGGVPCASIFRSSRLPEARGDGHRPRPARRRPVAPCEIASACGSPPVVLAGAFSYLKIVPHTASCQEEKCGEGATRRYRTSQVSPARSRRPRSPFPFLSVTARTWSAICAS